MSTPALDATLGPGAPAVESADAATATGRTRTAAGLRRWAVRFGSLAAVVALWQWLTTADARVGLRFDRLPSPPRSRRSSAGSSAPGSTTSTWPRA
ncbi:hypothetical protein [Microbispora sp. GKU 823]|uniref:hypothetical protein n=1 Tax=Microbispora sp. GKU 823 TaxID=1652100 RepID=UPI002118B77F|nr:hypothetical protein [Microbispora sp. GKU 823]